MDRLTRKDLKTDRFAQEVGHTVEYVGIHRKQFFLYGALALAVVIIAGGIFYYMRHQREQRQIALSEALRIAEAPVGPEAAGHPGLTFATEEERHTALEAAYRRLIDEHGGSAEAQVAKYHLGAHQARHGNIAEAERLLRESAGGKHAYGSLAKMSLAELYYAQGKTQEAEDLLRNLIENPTLFVSREMATIRLAQLKARDDPEEARKLLEPLRTEPGAVSRVAMSVLEELQPAP